MGATRWQRALMQATWEGAAPIFETTAGLFDGGLLRGGPEAQGAVPRRRRDDRGAGRKLMQMIGIAVRGLDRQDGTSPPPNATWAATAARSAPAAADDENERTERG